MKQSLGGRWLSGVWVKLPPRGGPLQDGLEVVMVGTHERREKEEESGRSS